MPPLPSTFIAPFKPPTDFAIGEMQPGLSHGPSADGEAWRDLDLVTPDGAALAPADRTVDPEDVPTELRQQIVVRVVAEQWTDGAVRERIALEHTLRPSDLIGTPISVRFDASDWPKPFPPSGMDVKQGFRSVTINQHEWTPVLVVGRERITQTAITSSGDLTIPSTSKNTVSMAQGVMRGLGAAVGGPFSAPTPDPSRPGTPAPPPPPGNFLTATWLEYEIQGPAERGRESGAPVFDLLGPAARGSWDHQSAASPFQCEGSANIRAAT